jgi:uncharacterized protein YbjT (DUF2867 family)
VSRLVAPVRRPVRPTDLVEAEAVGAAKVEAPVVDFDDLLSHAHDLAADQVFICLGTTMKKAGSRDAFRRVDLDAVVAAAESALSAGARDAFLVSSVGADPTARGFYLRTKGEAEAAMAALPFRSVQIARPSVLTGHRREFRPAERVGILLAGLLTPLMLGSARRYRPIPAERVARALVVIARDPRPGVHVYESERLARLGA